MPSFMGQVKNLNPPATFQHLWIIRLSYPPSVGHLLSTHQIPWCYQAPHEQMSSWCHTAIPKTLSFIASRVRCASKIAFPLWSCHIFSSGRCCRNQVLPLILGKQPAASASHLIGVWVCPIVGYLKISGFSVLLFCSNRLTHIDKIEVTKYLFTINIKSATQMNKNMFGQRA